MPGCQPSAARAEGGKSQTGAPEEELPAGVLQIKDEDLVNVGAVGDRSTIGTEGEIGVIREQGSPGRQAERLRGANPQAAGFRVCRDRPALEPQAFTDRDQALALRVKMDRPGRTYLQGSELLVAFAGGRQVPEHDAVC